MTQQRWPFSEGEWSEVDKAYIWQESIPACDAMTICHLHTKYAPYISSYSINITAIKLTADEFRAEDKEVFLLAERAGGLMYIYSGRPVVWNPWENHYQPLGCTPVHNKGRSQYIPNIILSHLGKAEDMLLVGGHYGGCLSDVAHVYYALGVRAHMFVPYIF